MPQTRAILCLMRLNFLSVVRVSQIQLMQPFLSLLFAVPLVGERLDGTTLAFAVAVIATVYIGKRMPVGLAQGVKP